MRSRRASLAIVGLPSDTDLHAHRNSPAPVDHPREDAALPYIAVSKVFQQEMMGKYSKRKVDIETQTVERGLTTSAVQVLTSQGYSDLPDLAPRTLYIFDEYNFIRKQALRLVLHPFFDRLMLLSLIHI